MGAWSDNGASNHPLQQNPRHVPTLSAAPATGTGGGASSHPSSGVQDRTSRRNSSSPLPTPSPPPPDPSPLQIRAGFPPRRWGLRPSESHAGARPSIAAGATHTARTPNCCAPAPAGRTQLPCRPHLLIQTPSLHQGSPGLSPKFDPRGSEVTPSRQRSLSARLPRSACRHPGPGSDSSKVGEPQGLGAGGGRAPPPRKGDSRGHRTTGEASRYVPKAQPLPVP